MLEQRYAIIPAKPEASRRRRNALCNRGRVVKHPTDDLRRDLSHARRLDMISEQVGDHPPSTSRGKTVQQEPLRLRHLTAVQTHI